MKTKLLITLLLAFSLFHTFAQDTIYKTDGSKIIAKVMEINANSVKFKLSSAGNETLINTPKSEITYIVYANGLKELYNMDVVVQKDIPVRSNGEKVKSLKDLKNIFAINCFDMFFTNFSVSYERYLNSGNFSVKVPLCIGLDGRPNTNNYTSTSDFGNTQFLQNRLYSTGLEFNVYPFGQTRSTFYIGVSAVIGRFNYYKDITDTVYVFPYSSSTAYPTYPVIGHTKYTGEHYAGMLHIGGYLGLSENILLGAKLGIGYKREDTIELDYTLPKVQFDLNLAYRF